MQSSIFTTYSTRENRVTASILAVMRFLSLQRTERLLGAIMEHSEFELVHFQNQPKGSEGVPDAIILSSCRILIETKVERNAIDLDQLRRHLEELKGQEKLQLRLVLTPDESRPSILDQLQDKPVVWAPFASLDQAIEDLLADNREVVSEREQFLLRHLQIMLVEEKLTGSADVVGIGARYAWPEYQKVHAYICQENRVFQQVRYTAFYSLNEIHPVVPEILEIHDSVLFQPGLHTGKLGDLVNKLLQFGREGTPYSMEEGERLKVILLSAPDDTRTQQLDGAIKNDLTSESGRTTAFTQYQRYVSLAQLKTAKKTSELVDGEQRAA